MCINILNRQVLNKMKKVKHVPKNSNNCLPFTLFLVLLLTLLCKQLVPFWTLLDSYMTCSLENTQHYFSIGIS